MTDPQQPSKETQNAGEPIRLADMRINGIAAESVPAGALTKMWTRLLVTSDDPPFHAIVENLSAIISDAASKVGRFIDVPRASSVLLVIHADGTADLWVDSAAVALLVAVKRDINAGDVVYERDIADIGDMRFPAIQVTSTDRVVYLFREGWRFALFADFTADEGFSVRRMERDLGKLFRQLKYRDLYDVVSNAATFDRMVEAGWFPFVEIIGYEFRRLSAVCQAGVPLDGIEEELLRGFDEQRVERMFGRWMRHAAFASKEAILRSAVNAFKNGDAVATLKIALTEIEGVLSSAYRSVHRDGARPGKLRRFAIESAKRKAGGPDTLFLPTAFAQYLERHTYAPFDPVKDIGKSVSRHAVGHGAAKADAYTPARALQALLTLDQLAFYL